MPTLDAGTLRNRSVVRATAALLCGLMAALGAPRLRAAEIGASRPESNGEREPVVVSQHEMEVVAREFLDAFVKADYSRMYGFLGAGSRAKTGLGHFASEQRDLREHRGQFVGFRIIGVSFVSQAAVALDVPGSYPKGAPPSRTSVAYVPTVWIRESNDWRLATLPWGYEIAQLAGGQAKPPKLYAVPAPEGRMWSAEREPVPECVDPKGLEGAVDRLMQAILGRDHAGIYRLLSAEARSKTPWSEFDAAMTSLEGQWLKPLRLVGTTAPELWVSVSLDFKPTAEHRAEIERRLGRRIGDILRDSRSIQLKRDGDEWRVWRGPW